MGMNDISSLMVLSIILSMPFSISSKNGTQGPHGKFKLIKNRLQKLFRKINRKKNYLVWFASKYFEKLKLDN